MDSSLGGVPESKVTVLIADEYANRRRTVRRVLLVGPRLHVVGEVADFDELLSKLETRKPQVLVASEHLLWERADLAHAPPRTVTDAIRTLVLTESATADWACPPLRNQLWGSMSYARTDQDLVKAVVAIAGGEMWFSRRQLADMLSRRADDAGSICSEQMILQGLTSREIEIVRLITRGRTNKEIAQALNISDLTVKSHVQNIFKKCGLRRRGELPGQILAA
jgi:DNA-binding NarL/FixJ family response regulator